jgi:hypothetical protein
VARSVRQPRRSDARNDHRGLEEGELGDRGRRHHQGRTPDNRLLTLVPKLHLLWVGRHEDLPGGSTGIWRNCRTREAGHRRRGELVLIFLILL